MKVLEWEEWLCSLGSDDRVEAVLMLERHVSGGVPGPVARRSVHVRCDEEFRWRGIARNFGAALMK